jgi:hypothetical protein
MSLSGPFWIFYAAVIQNGGYQEADMSDRNGPDNKPIPGVIALRAEIQELKDRYDQLTKSTTMTIARQDQVIQELQARVARLEERST